MRRLRTSQAILERDYFKVGAIGKRFLMCIGHDPEKSSSKALTAATG